MKYIGMPAGMWLLFRKSFQKNLSVVLGYDKVTAKDTTLKAKKTDILSLNEPDGSCAKVVDANVIHLPDEPEKALSELARVCRADGTLIIPTCRTKGL